MIRRPARARPAPPDLAANAATMMRRQLMAHYRCSQRVLIRWLADLGIAPKAYEPATKTAAPDDLAVMAARMGRNALSRHYGLSYNTIVRILAEEGIEAARERQPPQPQNPVPRRRMPPSQLRAYAGPKSAFTGALPRDASLEGRAADFLRRFAPVYRCNERGGVPDCKAGLTHWRSGAVVLTGAELVERARARGFDPDGWARLPAHLSPSRPQGMRHSEGA